LAGLTYPLANSLNKLFQSSTKRDNPNRLSASFPAFCPICRASSGLSSRSGQTRVQIPLRPEGVAEKGGRDPYMALGAAMYVDTEQRLPSEEPGDRRYKMTHVYLGPSFTDGEIERFLVWSKLPYRRLADVSQEVATYLHFEHQRSMRW
jgi:hypothetical protein